MDEARFDIVPATERDVGDILGLIKALAEYERLSDQVTVTEAGLRRTLFGDPPAAEALVAKSAGKTAGFAVWFQTYSTFLGRPGVYLEDLFVLPEYRQRGCGVALLARVAGIAVERGCARMDWSVLDWNEPAIRFYRALGASAQDEWTVYRLAGGALRKLAAKDTAGSAGE